MRKATRVHTKCDHQENIKRLIRFYDRLDNHMSSLKTTHQLYRCTSWDGITTRTKANAYCVNKDALLSAEHGLDAALIGNIDSKNYRYCGVDWETLTNDIRIFVGQSYGQFDDGFQLPEELQDEIDLEKEHLEESALYALAQDRLVAYQTENDLPRVIGKWRKEPYPPRSYERVKEYVVTNSIPDREATAVREQLSSSLSDGFKGPALDCDDMVHMEEWMCRFRDKGGNTFANEDTVARLVVESTVDHMVNTVQHRAYNEEGVVQRDPIDLGPQLKEVLVWGMDCYTRRMIELIVNDTCGHLYPAAPGSECSGAVLAAQYFIEKILLPCMNTQAPDEAHDMSVTLEAIEKDPSYPSEHRKFAMIIRRVKQILGDDHFRIHPKGTGVVCADKGGIRPDVFVSEYLGEIYPPYRWCEKLDVLRKVQNMYGVKPTLPDFYNILLEKHRTNSDGYGMIFVDASQFANMGSSCSHSCNANCTSAVVVRGGKTVIALTTNREVRLGEELTMDYYSVTSSEDEWRAAICLCGMRNCRGSFLQYSTRNDLQQVLNRFCSPLYRFASLANACTDVPIHENSVDMFTEYGLLDNALGTNSPFWMRKLAYEMLKFIEYERKSLPSALLRTALENNQQLNSQSLTDADADAHSVMESRIQAVVISFSVVRHLLDRQPNELQLKRPVRRYSEQEACQLVFKAVEGLPDLLFRHFVDNIVNHHPPSVGKNKRRAAEVKIKGEKAIKKIQKVIVEIRKVLKEEVDALWKLSKVILKIHAIMITIVGEATPVARLQQLADVLVLWAHTTNFLTAEKFNEVECDPVKVYSRELGNNVTRSKLTLNKRQNGHQKSAQPSKRKVESEDSVQPVKIVNISEDVAEDTIKTEVLATEATVRASGEDCGSGITADVLPARSGRGSDYLDPNEVVYHGKESYNPEYIFWQLMGWYNAGTDDLIESPDVMGTLQLPLPVQCFGSAEGNYGAVERKLFLRHITDEFKQSAPWPDSLKNTFSEITDDVPSELRFLVGSPFLDTVFGVGKVTKKLSEYFEVAGSGGNINTAVLQYDTMLPPEITHCSWIKCTECHKWRRVAWYLDPSDFPDIWTCAMNTWDVEKAACHAHSDYDPQTEDCGLGLSDEEDEVISEYLASLPVVQSLDECPVGSDKDVFCVLNRTWYKAKVLQHIQASQPSQQDSVRVHFLGWRSKFDETVPIFSGRIQDANKFSKVNRGKVKLGEVNRNESRVKRKKRPKMPDAVEVKSANSSSASAPKRTKKSKATKKVVLTSSEDTSKSNSKSKPAPRRPAKRPRAAPKNAPAAALSDSDFDESKIKKPRASKTKLPSAEEQSCDDTTTADDIDTCTSAPVSGTAQVNDIFTSESATESQAMDTQESTIMKPQISNMELLSTEEQCCDDTTTAEDTDACSSVPMSGQAKVGTVLSPKSANEQKSVEINSHPATASRSGCTVQIKSNSSAGGGCDRKIPAVISQQTLNQSKNDNNRETSSTCEATARSAQNGIVCPPQYGCHYNQFIGMAQYGQSPAPPVNSVAGHPIFPMQAYPMGFMPFMPNPDFTMSSFYPYFQPQVPCQMFPTMPGGVPVNPSVPGIETPQSGTPSTDCLPRNSSSE